MAMSPTTLSTELANLSPENSEAAAIITLSDAYATYCEDAEADTPIKAAGVALGKTAMQVALIGMSAPSAAAAKWTAGFIAFWVGVAGGLTLSFDNAIVITPPPFAGLAVLLQPVFDLNRDLEKSLTDSADTLAIVIHANVFGGTVTTPGPIVTPII